MKLHHNAKKKYIYIFYEPVPSEAWFPDYGLMMIKEKPPVSSVAHFSFTLYSSKTYLFAVWKVYVVIQIEWLTTVCFNVTWLWSGYITSQPCKTGQAKRSEDSSTMGLDTLLIATQLPTLLQLTHPVAGSRLVRNVGFWSPTDSASCPKILQSSWTPLWRTRNVLRSWMYFVSYGIIIQWLEQP